MSSFNACASLLVGVLLFAPVAMGTTLGAIGPVYPIGEQSALDLIMSRLRAKERAGELAELQELAVKRSLQTIEQLPPVGGITTVTTPAQRLIDPSVTYTHAVTTDDGRIVIPAGTTINPLKITALTKTLVFFDGRDPAQTEAVGALVAAGGARIKPILVAGS